jgi:hypothetical protein
MFKAETVTLKERYSREMGQRMGTRLLESLGAAPRAAWLFAAPGRGLRDMLAAVADTVGTPTIIGCTTDGEISSSGFSSGSAVLGGIVTNRIDFHVAMVRGLDRDSEAAGKEIARALPESVRYVQLFSDGLTGNGCAILRGMTSILGEDVPICGGAAADWDKFRNTLQFCGAEILSDAAVAIGFSGSFKVGTGVQSGWSPIGIARRVTRSLKNVVYELDGQPALEVYKRFFGKHAKNLPMVGIEYPLGLVDRANTLTDPHYNMILRASVSVDHREGSIKFAGEIPEGSLVRLTCGDPKCTIEAAERATHLALRDLGDCRLAIVFLFSCMARRIVLGSRTGEEVETVRRAAGVEVPVLGFYSYGEFCPLRRGEPSILHNETATVSVLGF